MNHTLGVLLAALFLAGCGTENPFSRGFETNDGGNGGPITGDVSFAANVVPALRGCPACHSSGAGGWTYAGGGGAYGAVASVVDTGSPANSLLLVKGSGGAGHGGGTVLSASSSGYATILAWIEQGARDN
ncbi:MAG: hypothetical protein SH809_13530 [Rhodothermales bacterium]|nr:hypothetical protein [Rhodothermales bacterium]